MIPPLNERELEALRQIGRHWNSAAGQRLRRLQELPVDPGLRRYAAGANRRRFRSTPMFKPEGQDEIVATAAAARPVSRVGRLAEAVERIVIGPPLLSSAVVHERMRKLIALPVLSSDLLASVAYGPEAMLSILVLGGSRALGLTLPLAALLVALMLAVGASYRQTIAAYPSGAGSYIVAGDNLGELAGVTAAVGLLADYILNVAVSVAAGVATIASAVPAVNRYSVLMGLALIALLLGGNLRGVREAGYLFAAPTYIFLIAMLLLLGVGLADAATNGLSATPPPPIKPVEGLTVLLVLKAFSSGATSMTGIEGVANAVPAFQPPEWRNARTTLSWMISILVVLFVGLMILIHLDGLVPMPNQTLLSQLAHKSFGSGALYDFEQGATALMLFFAANTSYNGFPRLLYFMARSGHAPRAFLRMGDRLAFSNGIIALTVVAAAIFVGFRAKTNALIPLFAVGVFLAVTLSQAGMVVHWTRTRGPHWRRSLAVNAFGGALTAIVVVVAAATKFTAGAWVVVIGIPLLVWLCLGISRYYRAIDRALAPRPLPETGDAADAHASRNGRPGALARNERQESPEQIQHLMLVAVERLDLANLRALAYAASLEHPLLAVHLSPDDDEAERFRRQWETWAVPLRLEIVVSPYRAFVAPLAHYVEVIQAQRPGLMTTVIVTELVAKRPWHHLLRSQVAPRLRHALRTEPNVVITTIPFHPPI